MPRDNIRIPLPFDQTISAVLKVKPPKREPKAGAKTGAKRPGWKPNTARAH